MAAALIHTAQFPIADLERNVAELNQLNLTLYSTQGILLLLILQQRHFA